MEQHHEHLDALTSIGADLYGRAAIPFGRLYGFDTKAAGTLGGATGLAVNIEHGATSLLHYTDTSNVDQERAVLMSRQGTALFFEDTEVAELEVFFHASEVRYQIVYCKYTWVASAGGSTPTFGTLAVVSSEPTDPYDLTSLGDDEFAIGYFTLAGGGSTLSDVSWTPWDKPNMAGKADLDTSIFAKLAETNKFTKANAFADAVALTETSLTDEGGGYYRLNLPDTSNIFTLNFPVSSFYNIQRIVTTLNEDGQFLFIRLMGGSVVKWFAGSPPGIYMANGYNQSSGQTTDYMFIRISGNWIAMAMPTTFVETFNSQASSIGSLNTLVNSNISRLLALEAEAVAAETSSLIINAVVGDWTIDLTLYVRGENKWVRGTFVCSGAVSAEYLTVGNVELDYFGMIPIVFNPVSTNIPVLGGLYFDSITHDIKLKHNGIAGAGTFFLPRTQIKP